jgi:hypothetical protein
MLPPSQRATRHHHIGLTSRWCNAKKKRRFAHVNFLMFTNIVSAQEVDAAYQPPGSWDGKIATPKCSHPDRGSRESLDRSAAARRRHPTTGTRQRTPVGVPHCAYRCGTPPTPYGASGSPFPGPFTARGGLNKNNKGLYRDFEMTFGDPHPL